jgi:CRISPR-associated protein Csm1
LAIDWQEVSFENIRNKKINGTWHELIDKLNLKKRQRHKEQLIDKYDYFFEPKGFGGELERDALTGEEFLENEKKVSYLNEVSGKKESIKPYTEQQIRLGKILKQAKYWISSDEKLAFINERYQVETCNMGIINYFLPEDELANCESKLRDAKGKVRVLNINQTNFLDTKKGINNIYGFNLYGGNDFPADNDGSPLTFDEFAGDGDFKRLGFLRMDVDNLGIIFSKGFTDEKCTFSRYSSLSRSLDYFFKGYINTIWKKEKYNKSTFIIYSGGDDLFLVGRWDKLIEIAEEIREQFSLWTCQNPNLSISGGVAVVPDKFPVLKAAQEAAIAEHAAKNHKLKNDGKEKNSFTLLNVPLNWDAEYPLVKDLKNTIKNFLEHNKLPNSFVSKLQSHFANARIKNGEITKLNVLWLMAYDFARLADSMKKADTDARQFVLDIKDWIFTNQYPGLTQNISKYHVFELINLATRWAELELRTNKK